MNEAARRFHRTAVGLEEARLRLLAHAAPVGVERVPLTEAYGRLAAERVAAAEPVPHFRRSGMDGYAVRAADTAGAASESPVLLRVVGAVACGDAPEAALAPGEAMRVMTGAMLPAGADAVAMLEAVAETTVRGAAHVVLRRSAAPGANVSAIGSDVAAGTTVVEPGRRLGPAEIALLATVGRTHAIVYRKPRVAILATGSELLPPEAPLVPGKIRNSNVFMLAAQTIAAGAEPVPLSAAPDDMGRIAAAVEEGLASCDLTITSGGVSVGDYDVVTDLLHEWDGELLFNKVRMRPGSVTSAGVRLGKLLLALSGNPGACFAGFELFARPVILALQGDPRPGPAAFEARLAEAFPKPNAYPRYVRGRWWSESGVLYAAAGGGDQSSRMLPGLGADCFVVIPPGGSGTAAGSLVTVVPLRG
ncbi:gephyrin-like molybdotransferase Glp [Paenibacillus sp.]|uniref:molybdopterin molybdotransferase MoeA n=1 Tax=Paenibacillus sp. TaxID=58172 RepID=UPI0028114C51|nr:gephyrin-like molybdotransferase Glp [Paenibacillus sp.]